MRVQSLLCGLAALTLLAGCGSSPGKGVSDQKIIDALHLRSVAGAYTIAGTICGVSKLLHTTDEVSTANNADSGSVLASRDESVGIVILPPFAKNCAREARRGLDKLANAQ